MLGQFLSSVILETLLEFLLWVVILPPALILGTPVILGRALRAGRHGWHSLVRDYRGLFRWWWEWCPFRS